MIDVERGQNSVLVYPVIVQRTGGEYYQQLTKSSLEPNQPKVLKESTNKFWQQ